MGRYQLRLVKLSLPEDVVGKIKYVDISDPRAIKEDIFRIYGKDPIPIQPSDLNKYDVVILAVNHTEYEGLYSGEWILPNQVVFDVKSVIRSDKVLSL